MELRNLRTFLRVADLTSFSRAAEELHYTQSAVTIQIQQLENELGVKLFERIGRSIALTRHGDAFLDHAREVVQAADAALAFLKEPDSPKGPLRIGTVESLASAILPDVLEELHSACPLVETVVRTSSIDKLVEMLKRNEMDIIYFLDRKLHNLEWVKAAERPVDIVFVASGSHRLARPGRVPLREIVREPFILTERGVNYRYELELRLAAKNFKIVPYLDIENTDIIIRLLHKGTSVSFLPAYTVKEEIDSGKLAVLDVAEINVKMWEQLIYHRKKTPTP